jgi:hypothetical protein
MRGTSGYYLLGGIHMTDNGLLPFLLAKLIACSECADDIGKTLTVLAPYFQEKGIASNTTSMMTELSKKLDRSLPLRKRFRKVQEVQTELGGAYYLPWFLACNQDRFPSWYGKLDNRVFAADS